MAFTMLFLPLEVLHQICNYLTNHVDVANFRLVCRMFSSVGLDSLAPRVSFAVLPESLDRLSAIASHPVLRHHVHTVVCLADVLPRYESFERWKDDARRPGLQLGWVVEADDERALEADTLAQGRHQIPDAELQEGWQAYTSALAAQEKAFKFLEDPLELTRTFRGLTSLRTLEIKSNLEPLSIHTFKKLFDSCLIRPLPLISHPLSPDRDEYFGLPGVKPLRSLLTAAITTKKKITSLRVDMLDCCLFDDEEPEIDSLAQGIDKLRVLQLDIVVREMLDDSTPWQKAKDALSSDRLKTFLCSAPELEVLDIQFAHDLFEPFIANAVNIFPQESKWQSLKSLKLAGISFDPSSFLGFLGCHSKTLKHVYLSNCDLVVDGQPVPPIDGPDGENHGVSGPCWSDFFIPLSAEFFLTTLRLSGVLTVYRRPDPDSLEYIDPHDEVRNIGLSVICSKPFNDFLRRKVECSQNISADTIKACMIQDLVDHAPVRTDPPRTVEITIRYESYLKEFVVLRFWQANE